MKYLILFMVVLALLGCDNNPGGTSNAESYLDKPLQAKVDQRGLYRLVRSGGIVDDPNTGTGKAVAKPVIELVKSTERIPLMKGAQLYLQYRFWYLPDQPPWVELRRVLKHPEMKLPDGSVSTGSDYAIKQEVSVNQAIGYTGYGLDEDYELVEGDWVFELWYQDKKMIEQKFTTYWPDEEEIAELEPVLALGNNVLTRIEQPNNPDPKLNWPRIIVGEKEIAESPALSEMKQAIEDERKRKLAEEKQRALAAPDNSQAPPP